MECLTVTPLREDNIEASRAHEVRFVQWKRGAQPIVDRPTRLLSHIHNRRGKCLPDNIKLTNGLHPRTGWYLLPFRRNHIIQKVRITDMRTLSISVHDSRSWITVVHIASCGWP